MTERGALSTDDRAALARSARTGALLLPGFVLFDLFFKYQLYPDANLYIVEALRALAIAFAWLASWIASTPQTSARVVRASHVILLGLIGGVHAGMANQLGGLTSLYIQSLSLMVMVRAGTVAEPFTESVPYAIAIALSYPLVFLGIYIADPAAHADWRTSEALTTFAANYLFACSTMAVGCIASRASWIAQNQLRQARKLGRYRLEARIGKGGQGEVWLAHDPLLHRKVALKVMHGEQVATTSLRLFEREAALASQLQTAHAVRIFDFGASDDGVAFLAMEYLDGADLSALLRDHGAMPAARVAHLAIQVCRALEEAHAKGLVHRDLKPSNLFVTRTADAHDHVKLVDFGIARSFLEATSDLTRTGNARGTFAYMAPECCRGEPATPASDLYNLGATLYQLASGAPPFTGSDAELVAHHLSTPPTALRERLPSFDEGLDRLILACLAKDPSQRPRSAAVLRGELEALGLAAAWTASDATRFWQHERQSAHERWQADTVL